MKTRRIMAVVLAALMMLSIIPVAFAEEISSISADAALSVRMDDAWAAIELAEAEALADNLPASDVINAVYTAALNNENVDADSFSDFTADGFFFTVNGMHCAYNYRLRNKIEANVTEEGSVTFNASNGKVVEMRDATSPNVLLVGPYYGGRQGCCHLRQPRHRKRHFLLSLPYHQPGHYQRGLCKRLGGSLRQRSVH